MAHDPGGDQPPHDRTDYDHCPLYSALVDDDERAAAELGGASRDPDLHRRYPA